MAPLAPVLDILQTRLAARRIGMAAGGQSHIPEQAMRLNRLNTGQDNIASPASRVSPNGFVLISRPSLLLAPPQPAQVITTGPSNTPEHIQWQGRIYTCQQVIGPERLTTPWWTGMPPVTRDYFAVLDQTGQWLLHGVWV